CMRFLRSTAMRPVPSHPPESWLPATSRKSLCGQPWKDLLRSSHAKKQCGCLDTNPGTVGIRAISRIGWSGAYRRNSCKRLVQFIDRSQCLIGHNKSNFFFTTLAFQEANLTKYPRTSLRNGPP